MDTNTELSKLYEAMYDIPKTGNKPIAKTDVSNLLFKLTDGGREFCTIYTVRKTDSKTDLTKKAGQPMKITGRLGACQASLDASNTRQPALDTPVQYKKNDILRMCVSSIDGEDYTKKYLVEYLLDGKWHRASRTDTTAQKAYEYLVNKLNSGKYVLGTAEQFENGTWRLIEDRTRSFDVLNITKIEAGGNTYTVV